jgi:lysine 2,3-aminomutase
VNLPSRITPGLVAVLRRYQSPGRPVYVVTHFNHPRELAPENHAALAALADAGIVLRNQSVLLAGVNDDAASLEALFRGLADHRVVPYYLHQLDLARGTNHFRVPIERGIALMRSLQGRLSGIALPRYVLDVPGGKGKVPLTHQYLAKADDGTYAVECMTGETVVYREPASAHVAVPPPS